MLKAAIWLTSLAVALVSWRFLVGGVAATMPDMVHHALDRPFYFYAHVGLAPVALALAPFQLWAGLRTRRPRVHRWTGRGYGVAVLGAGAGGVLMALNTHFGPVAATGFGLLAALWLGTTGWGIARAIAGDLDGHRRWMLRSVALTFAAVTLRLYLPAAQILGLDFTSAYVAISWLCWVPNLLVAEWVVLPRAGRVPVVA